MKPFARFALTGLLMLLAAHGAAQETRTETLRSGGIERRYVLHLPDSLPDGAPLVIVLHGYGGDADPEYFGMNATADRHRFAVCYPQGERDGRGKRCWNVGYPFQADMPVDDIRFLEPLLIRALVGGLVGEDLFLREPLTLQAHHSLGVDDLAAVKHRGRAHLDPRLGQHGTNREG